MKTEAEPAGEDTGKGAGRVRAVAPLAAVAAAMLGGAHLVSLVAGYAGLPVSRQVFFEGEWAVYSWSRLPWADCAGMLCMMVALPAAWARMRGVSLGRVGFRVDAKSAAWAAAAFAGLGAALLLGHKGLGEAAAIRGVYFGAVALAEETAFRGTIQRRLVELAGPAAGIALATAGFVLWHGLGGGWAVIAVRAAAGAALAGVYYATKGLAAPVAWHWAFDMLVTAGA